LEQITDHYIVGIYTRRKRRMVWAGHVESAGNMINAYNIWVESLKGRDHLGDLGVGVSIALRWILGK
jgi:hypothetical protein